MRYLIAPVVFATMCFGGQLSAQAACSWTTLTNGTTADATQVMSNFDCLAPIANPHFSGAVGIGTASPGSTLSVQSGSGSWKVLELARSGLDVFEFHLSSNGTSSYLSLGESTAEQLVLTASGNVGIDTTTPVSRLTLGSGELTLTHDNAINFNGTASSGSQPNVYYNQGSNALFVNSGISGSYTQINAGLVILKDNGRVGIGTTTPAQSLEVNGQVQIDSLASGSATNLCINGAVVSSCSSSLRYKEDVKSASFGLREVLAMRPVSFKWKGRDERDIGLVAEEVAKLNPIFATFKAGRVEGVKYSQLAVVLIKAIQEQQREIASLRLENTRLSHGVRMLQISNAKSLADHRNAVMARGKLAILKD